MCVCVCCRGFGLRLAFVALPMQTKLYDKDVKEHKIVALNSSIYTSLHISITLSNIYDCMVMNSGRVPYQKKNTTHDLFDYSKFFKRFTKKSYMFILCVRCSQMLL